MFRGHLCSCTWTPWFCLETGHTQSYGKMQVWTPKPNVNTGEARVRYRPSLSQDGTVAHQSGSKCLGVVGSVSFRMSSLVEEPARLQCYMSSEFFKRLSLSSL